MANQYKVDPRQALFLKAYLDPKSATFSNALQSALSVGYSREYAENITNQLPDWLAENLGTERMLKKAEKNLDTLMDSKNENIKADISKFVTGRLGKKKWSERQEVTGPDGKDLQPVLVKFMTEHEQPKDNRNTA